MTVLNEGDIKFMSDSLDEVYSLRERPITVSYLDIVRDDITGEIIGKSEISREVNAVVTEISLRSKDGSRYLENGIEYEQGDVKIDIKLEYIEGIADKLSRVKYDGKEYELLGGDKKGIGRRNRIEFIGRVMA